VNEYAIRVEHLQALPAGRTRATAPYVTASPSCHRPVPQARREEP
jgi:hypothetical protein